MIKYTVMLTMYYLTKCIIKDYIMLLHLDTFCDEFNHLDYIELVLIKMTVI